METQGDLSGGDMSGGVMVARKIVRVGNVQDWEGNCLKKNVRENARIPMQGPDFQKKS